MAITYTNTMVDFHRIYKSWTGSTNYGGAASQDMNYWRTPAQVGDWIMFGRYANYSSQTGEASMIGAFDDIQFNVAVAVGLVGYTYVWEYYGTQDGAADWYTLTCTDNTDGFQNTGSNTLDFVPPFDWYKIYYNSVHLVPIRIRITGVSSGAFVGTQASENIKGGENILRVTSTETIEDLYDDDVSNGWGVVTRSGFIETTQRGGVYPDFNVYYINAYLSVGDGSTPTALSKLNGYVYCTRSICCRNNATLTLGREGADGYGEYPLITFAVWDATGHLRAWPLCDSGGTFTAWGGMLGFGNGAQVLSGGALNLYETNIICRGGTTGGALQCHTDDVVMRRVTITSPIEGIRAYGNVSIDDLTIVSGSQGLWFGYSAGDVTLSQIKITGGPDTTQLFPVSRTPGGQTCYLDDCNIEDETSCNKYYNFTLGVKFRHTWSALVKDEDGDPIEGVAIVCKNKDDDTEFSVETGADGETGEQKIVRRYIQWVGSQTGAVANAGTHEVYNPFEFTFSKSGYQTQIAKQVTLLGGTMKEIQWVVVLLELSENILDVVCTVTGGNVGSTVAGELTGTIRVEDTQGGT